uniref:SFRICE_023833 n=1 Tax=Spodoptera frugiperda TaxID=7108 RepID=A0A2H1WK63_SPOFR
MPFWLWALSYFAIASVFVPLQGKGLPTFRPLLSLQSFMRPILVQP